VDDIVSLLGGLVALYFGGEFLLRGAMGAGERLNFTPIATGLVLVALGTSAPELAVSLDAALTGHGDMAVGNVIGSNIVNIALVLGIAASVRHIPTPRSATAAYTVALAFLTALTVWFLNDARVSANEGFVLLGALALTLFRSLRNASAGDSGEESDAPARSPMRRHALEGLVGITLLVVGAELAVTGGIGVARLVGVSEAVIALTITAIGTGLPEIAATVVALTRGMSGVALGNVIGSNLINIGLVLGLSAVIAPLHAPGVGTTPLVVLVALTIVLTVIVLIGQGVRRWVGFALLSSFGLYNLSLFT
jgi:cation:H+ antiporter